jgi:hypothetical protein
MFRVAIVPDAQVPRNRHAWQSQPKSPPSGTRVGRRLAPRCNDAHPPFCRQFEAAGPVPVLRPAASTARETPLVAAPQRPSQQRARAPRPGHPPAPVPHSLYRRVPPACLPALVDKTGQSRPRAPTPRTSRVPHAARLSFIEIELPAFPPVAHSHPAAPRSHKLAGQDRRASGKRGLEAPTSATCLRKARTAPVAAPGGLPTGPRAASHPGGRL